MVSNKFQQYTAWFLLFAWLGIIWMLSNQAGASSHQTSGLMARLVYRILEILPGDWISFHSLKKLIRKIAHFTEYFILCLLLFNVIRLYFARLKAVWITAGICLFLAAMDELHQYFIPGRNANPKDIVVDMMGVIAAICFVWIVSRYTLRLFKTEEAGPSNNSPAQNYKY